jgi:hypothetical protein
MKWFAYALSILCGLVAVQIAVSAWATLHSQTVQPQVYVSYVQMLITFITAVLLAVYNFAATRSNDQERTRLTSEANKEFARLQSALSVETANSVEKIRAEFTASVNATTESLRYEFGRSSEEFKARLGQTIPQKYNGYHAMFKAATKYFFAIRRLEEGIYPENDLQAATIAADDAIGSALVVDSVDRAAFFALVTEATFIAESARVIAVTAPDDDRSVLLMAHWESNGKRFGKGYNELQDAFAAKVRS